MKETESDVKESLTTQGTPSSGLDDSPCCARVFAAHQMIENQWQPMVEIGHQTFGFGPLCESEKEAAWWCDQFRIALAKISHNDPGQATADHKPKAHDKPRDFTMQNDFTTTTDVFEVSGTELDVCRDIASRQQRGIRKYGMTVATNPAHLLEWLQHAYEESLDKAIYLKRAMREIHDANALFADLIEQWERRIQTANELANDAAGSGDYVSHERCLTKAGTIRSMIVELKREILQANVRSDSSDLSD